MGAAVARAQEVVSEDRIVALESDVKRAFTDIGEIKGSVKALEGKVQELGRKSDDVDEKVDGLIVDIHSFKTEVAKEFGALRELLRVQIGEVRAEIGELRVEMIERFGHLKIWVLVTIAGTLASLVSMAMSIATFVHGWKSP